MSDLTLSDQSTSGRSQAHGKAIWHCLILSAVTAAVWATGAFGDFVWIDHVEIEQAGYRVTNVEDLKQVWSRSLDSYLERESGQLAATGGYYRPIYAMLISLDWKLWGANPLPYHTTNIVVHICVVIGLYFLGIQILPESPNRQMIALAAALLFAVHPFGVHSVTWISGRKDSLCALFSIISLLSFGSLIDRHKKTSLVWQGLVVFTATISLNLAILCKELAIVMPAFATVWIWYSLKHRSPKKISVFLLSLFWLSSLAAILLRYVLLGGIGLNIDYPSASFLSNALISAKLVCFYVLRIVLPIGPTVVDRWPISGQIGPFEIAAVVGTVVLLAVLVTCILRRHPVGLLLSWYLIWLLPATGIVPLRHMYAERYLYPATWGVLISVLYLAQPRIEGWFKRSEAFTVLSICVAILFAQQVVEANRFWRSDAALFTHSVDQDKKYAEGLSALALLELNKGNFKESLAFANRAIEAAWDPSCRSYWSPFVTYNNAGLASLKLRNLNESRQFFERARECRPNHAYSYYHLGLVDVARGSVDTAILNYQEAISIDSDHHLSRNNLAHIFLVQQRLDECISVLSPTIKSEPENRLAQANFATAFLLKKDFANAEKHFEVVVRLEPNDAISLAKLAWSEFEQIKWSEGRAHLAEAKQIAPEHPTVIFVDRKYVWSR